MARSGTGRTIIAVSMSEARTPDSVAETREALAAASYLADEPAALVSFLAQRLGKPILVEGPAGVGKTELAKALSRAGGRELIRLQCYEGLDEAKALYEWNYRKQLLWIQAAGKGEAAPGRGNEDPSISDSLGPHGSGGGGVWSDIFSEEFLLCLLYTSPSPRDRTRSR